MTEVQKERNEPAGLTAAQAQAQAAQAAALGQAGMAGGMAPAAMAQPPMPTANASLYVGDLNETVTEAHLFEKFNSVGPVASIRVCRDNVSRRSLGYAYVNFVSADNAKTAIQDMNHDPIEGRPMRIMFSERDPSKRRSGVGNICVTNLHPDIDARTLQDTFEDFGAIVSCKVVTDQQGNSRGYGFVQYESEASAKKAIEQVDGMLLMDKQVKVKPYRSRQETVKLHAERAAQFTNLYVRDFGDTTEEALTALFAPFGEITSKRFASNDKGSFAFVCFEKTESAQEAVKQLHEKKLDNGATLYVQRFKSKREHQQHIAEKHQARKRENQQRFKGVNLYVKNFDESVDDAKLREAFAPHGEITSCTVMLDAKGTSRCFGFVCYSSPEEATKAVTEMNGRALDIAGATKRKPLYVALAQRRDERLEEQNRQFMQRKLATFQNGQPYGMAAPMQQMFMPMQPGMAPMPGARYFPQQQGARPGMRPNFPQQQMYGQMPGAPYQQVPGAPPQQQQGGARNQQRNAKAGGRSGGRVQQQPMGMPVQQQQQMQMQQQQQQQQQPASGLSPARLAAATPEQQKQMLGEELYPKIMQRFPQEAGKVTGMLLEMDNAELIHLLETPTALVAKATEAIEVLRRHKGAN